MTVIRARWERWVRPSIAVVKVALLMFEVSGEMEGTLWAVECSGIEVIEDTEVESQ